MNKQLRFRRDDLAQRRHGVGFASHPCRIADRPDPVPDALWEKVARHYSQPEIAALLVDIALINSWNRFNVAVKQMVGEKWENAA